MKKLLFVFLSFFISFSSNAKDEKGPFFWKAEKEGRILHILGTVHSPIPLEDLQCSREISQSLNQSNLVWTEMNEKSLREKTQMLDSEKLLDPSKQSFQMLNEESKAFFREQMPEQIPEAQVLEFLSQFNYLGFISLSAKICHARHSDSLESWPKKNLTTKEIENFQIPVIDLQIQNLASDKEIPQNSLDESEEWENVIEYIISFIPTPSKEDVENRIKNFEDSYCSWENVKAQLEYTFIHKKAQLKPIILDYLSGQSSWLFVRETSYRKYYCEVNSIRFY